MNEPRLIAKLEDDDKMSPEMWTSKALLELARQMGVMNDYYYPLIGAARMLSTLTNEQKP